MVTPNHLSILGIIHTAISILALLAGLLALFSNGKVDPTNGWGKRYFWLTVLTCLTGFPIMRFGHPTPGHYLGVIILVLLAIAYYAKRIFGKAGDYVLLILMSTTLFLSFIPAIVETSTRLPISHPLAEGPNDLLVQKGQMVLLIIFVVGVIYQVVKLRAQKKSLNSIH
ncbi:MAG TPA: hypothetical protein VGI43_00520 [Mucilaginibacter sp.]|jgi:uncharacterized membrane protein